MKIIHYIDTFSRLSETFIYDLLCLLQDDSAKSGMQHIVLCHQRENKDSRPCKDVYVIEFGYTKFRRLQIKLGVNKWEIPSIKEVHKFILLHKPDLIHAHFGQSGVRMADYFRKKGVDIPLVVQCHGTDAISLPHFDKEYLNMFKKIGSNRKNLFVGNTEFLCNTIENIGVPKNRIKKVTYSLNNDFGANLKSKIKTIDENGILKIIAVGRLIKWKGHKYLIDAIHEIYHNVTKNIRLTIIGDGGEMDALKEQARTLGIKDIITFTGSVSHSEVKKIILIHDLLVQPSMIDDETKQRESFGLTILEAIACGLPVVVTNTGGMPELVGSETALSRIVEPASSQSLAAAIKFFIDNPVEQIAMKEYSKNRLDLFSQNNQLEALYTVYDNLLNDE
jgi:glycosyltransferase involved in cell wall biosynthesis